MPVLLESIKPGAVFRFKTALRLVVSLDSLKMGAFVNWMYADGKPRGGRLGGRQWITYFRQDAIELLPDKGIVSSFRTLKSQREVGVLREQITISIKTNCPGKWAFVDLETGDLWGHDGNEFKRLSPAEQGDLASAVNAGIQRTSASCRPIQT